MSDPSVSPSTPRLLFVGDFERLPALEVEVAHCLDSDEFLLGAHHRASDVHVVHLRQRGVPGLQLLAFVRRHGSAGLIAVAEDLDGDLAPSLNAGADVVVGADRLSEHLPAALALLTRWARRAHASTTGWRLDSARRVLLSPEGTPVDLAARESTLLCALAEAPDLKVSQELLQQRLWADVGRGSPNALQALVYRLRQRVEQATGTALPLRAVMGHGYQFDASLSARAE